MRHCLDRPTVIVGKHTLLREGVAALLRQPPYNVVASAPRASELREFRSPPDGSSLALIAIDERVDLIVDVLEESRSLREKFAPSRIVIIAETGSLLDLKKITTIAPVAYISNLTSRKVLLKTLELATLSQVVFVMPAVTTPISATSSKSRARRALVQNGHDGCERASLPNRKDRFGDPIFSVRERQILCRLTTGPCNREIARQLAITESTAKGYLKALLQKIPLRNRTQAAVWALVKGYSV